MNLFQSIVLAIFGLLAITAVVIFSMQSSGSGQLNFAGTFTVWGTFPAESMAKAIEDFNDENSKFYKIEYVEKEKPTFQGELVSALAAGTGPDLIILPESLLLQNLDKILSISYEEYSARSFSDSFIDGSLIFTNNQGVFGLPLLVDPLVMYWNKDIFSTGGVANYPLRWGEFVNLVDKLTISDRGGNVSQAAVALGSYKNINYAKDILSALFMQSGNTLVAFSSKITPGNEDKKWPVALSFGRGDVNSIQSAVSFFLDFSDPSKKAYSWNVAMQDSRNAFAGGSLATYFGHASDLSVIQDTNPHLNFGVAEFPQRDGEKKKITSGNFYAVAVTRGTSNIPSAKQIALTIATSDFAKTLSKDSGLPPARRDLLALGSLDKTMSVFYSSSIISRSWLDPSPIETEQIFQEMIDTVLSGVKKSSEAIAAAAQKLNNLIK